MAKKKGNKPVVSHLIKRAFDLINASRTQVLRHTNTLMVFTYYQLGGLIIENEQGGTDRAAYGKEVIKELSAYLTKKFGDGFSERNLDQMRLFYLAFKHRVPRIQIPQTLSAKSYSIQKPQTLSAKSLKNSGTQILTGNSFAELFPLSWSHYVLLSRIKNASEQSFYEIETIQGNWSVRELQRQYDGSLYERLALSKNKKKVRELASKGQVVSKPEDVLKSSYVLEFLGLEAKSNYTETDLETAIISRIEHFLIEMGKGFLFQGRQVRFSFDGEDFFVDLVLYNRLLQCFVLVDLKIGKIRHQDIGQMQMYVNYYNRYIKTPFEKPTIGIIICKDKSDAVVEITLPKNNRTIFAKEYKLYLPSKSELIKLINDK
jgi:predicted nuclease of restriction endonuclease-like (RecB) superfamily